HVPARRQAVDDAEADVVARGAVAPARVAEANHHPHELRLSPTLPPLSLAPFRLAAALAFGRRGLGGRRRRGTLGRHALGRYGFASSTVGGSTETSGCVGSPIAVTRSGSRSSERCTA